MEKQRKHERMTLMADLILQQAGDTPPLRFAGRVFNVSPGGVALFSSRHFPAGVLLTLELTVPVPGEGLRGVTLYGATRWARPEADGTLLGIELMAGAKAGDYVWFVKHLNLFTALHGGGGRRESRAAAGR
jgi:hypothetical protein